MKRFAFSLLSLVCTSLLNAQPEGGVLPHPDSPKNFGELALFAPITRADSAMDVFFKVPANTALIPSISKVYRNEKFIYFPLAVNIVEKDGESYRVKYSLSLRDPDGSEKPIFGEIVEGVAQNAKTIQFVANIGVILEDSDPLGKYEFIYELENLTNGRKAKTITSVELAEWARPEPMASAEEIGDAVWDFNENYLPTTLYSIMTSKALDYRMGNGANPTLYSFFKFAFERNEFLLAYLAAEFPQMDPLCRANVCILFESFGKSGMLKGASAKELEEAVEFVRNAEAEKDKNMGSVIDFLWGEFFATGKYEPIEKIIGFTKFKAEGKKTLAMMRGEKAGMTDEVLRMGIAYIVSGWSIDARMQKGSLLYKYVRSYLAGKDEKDVKNFFEALRDGRTR